MPIAEAVRFEGSPTREAFDKWLRRFNVRNPDRLIRRRWGKIHRADLLAAIDLEVERQTPNFAGAGAISKVATS